MVISGVKVNDSKAYGSLNFDSNHNLLSMTEKGLIGPAVINSGTYLVSKSAIMQFSSSKFSFEESFIPSVINSTKVYLFDGDFIDIGIPEDYYKACEIL